MREMLDMDGARRYLSAASRPVRSRGGAIATRAPATGRSALTTAGAEGGRHATSGATSDGRGDDAELLAPHGPTRPGGRSGDGSSGPRPGRERLGHERREHDQSAVLHAEA